MKRNSSSNKSPRRVTQYDIAAALNVSQVTVSLALRSDPRISAPMQERVKEKAQELGYHPDPMLSALANYTLANQETKKNATLAWINPFDKPQDLRAQQEFDLYWQGAQQTAKRLGFGLEEFATTKLSMSRMDQIFKTRNIQGLIIATLPPPHPSKDWQHFPWKDYATVRFGRSNAYPNVHHITSAQVRNAERAFQKIRQRGYQRIGFAGHVSRTRYFKAGVAQAQFEIPQPQRIPPFLYGKKDTEYLYCEGLNNWIKTFHPDAIFTDSPHLPHILQEQGYRIPEDIALATTSLHDTLIDAGIDQNPEEIGRAAVRMIVSLLTEQNFGLPEIQNEMLIDGKWVDGSMLPQRNHDV